MGMPNGLGLHPGLASKGLNASMGMPLIWGLASGPASPFFKPYQLSCMGKKIFEKKKILFDPLIAGRFPKKKYDEILFDFDYYFHVFWGFSYGVFLKPNFTFLASLLVFYHIKH